MTRTSKSPASAISSVTRYCLLLVAFFIPFSTALTNFFVVLTLVGFVAMAIANPGLLRPLRSPPAWLALTLLVLLLVGVTWSIAPADDVHTALRKYSKLLLLPVVICLCEHDTDLSRRALRWALAGSAYLAFATYLTWLGWMPTSRLGWWSVGAPDDPSVFRNHITTGILLSFAACVCFAAATYRPALARRIACIGAGIYFSIPIVLLGQGRTGYVTLFIGLVVLFLLRTRFTPLRALAGIGAIALMFVAFYQVVPNFKARTDALIQEVSTHKARSPNGLRMSFLQVGTRAVAAHPIIGLGTGSFSEAYAPTARATWPPGSPMAVIRHQPHSEFLLIAVQLGLVGFVVYLALLATVCRPAFATRQFETDVLALLGAIYIISSTFNSLLWDPTEGYWFLLLSGCLYTLCSRLRPAPAHAKVGTLPAAAHG
jgi:O-antigen ligase